MIRTVERILGAILLCAALIWGADYLSLKLRFPGDRPQMGSVNVMTFLVFNEKFNKLSYGFQGQSQQACSNSLLPEMGAKPCWWLKHHDTVMIPAVDTLGDSRDKIDTLPR